MNISQLERALGKYVPPNALEHCVKWITQYRISVRITKSRHSKYGDYRPPSDGKGHRISINHDLNKYTFLLTFVHEVAHLVAHIKYYYNIEPHGTEWKQEYKLLMQPLIHSEIFPTLLITAINKYMNNPAASSCSDLNLMRALAQYDERSTKWKLLEELKMNTPFKTKTGRTFVKGELLNKNFCCICLKSKHKYVINPLTEVMEIENNSL